jgi:hypothetical protein
MLQLCLDDCGKLRDSQYVSLAGWVSDSARWEGFSQRWRKEILQHYKIRAVHMNALMSLQGEYSGRQWTKTKAFDILRAAAPIIKDSVLAGIGVAVDCGYLRAMPQDARERIGDPVMLCFQRCVKLVVDRLRAADYDYPFAVICDDCEEYAMRMYSMLRKIKRKNTEWKKRIGGISFVDDELYCPVQAADVFSYMSTKALQDGYRGGYDRIIETSVEGIAAYSELYGSEALDELSVLLEQNKVILEPEAIVPTGECKT